MKNEHIKYELERELEGVRVSRDLKRRILTEASASRAPSRRTGFSIRPLAVAAAVMVTIGLSAGVIALRAEKPDLSATPLSPNSVSDSVWAGGDGLYHGREVCGEQTGMRLTKPENARAEGLKACSECFDPGDKAVEDLVWMVANGIVYHAVPDCSGMEGAVGVLEIEAKTLGREKCGVCLDGEMLESWPEMVYATSTPWLTQEAGSFQTLPWQDPDQGEVTYAFGTPEPTVQPRATLTPMPTAEENRAYPTPRSTPEPTPMPTPEPEEIPITDADAATEGSYDAAGDVVWMTGSSEYYHSDEHCSGMEGAGAASRSEAILADKKPCDACTVRILWTNDGGKSCHLAKNCSGMEDAEMIVLQPGDTSHQVGCLVCAAGGIPVWMTENGLYHHLDEHCSGMENAVQIMQSEALAVGKQACPTCMLSHETDGLSTVFITSDTDGPSTVFVTRDADGDMVWMNEDDGVYYHADEYCASHMTVAEFRGMGKVSCAVCCPEGLDAAAMVYSDDRYYHTDRKCAERTAYVLRTVSEAEACGRGPCVLCMPEGNEERYYDESVWMTEDGKLYHLNQYCAYDPGAIETAESIALAEGKQPCPQCLASQVLGSAGEAAASAAEGEQIDVFVGKEIEYHADESCPGLVTDGDGYTIVDERGALSWGKIPCEECLAVRYEVLDAVDYTEIVQSLKAETEDVWTTDGGIYYHTDEHCSGMANASAGSVADALKDGKQPCPTCARQFDEVWATENAHVYHLSDDCMGIIGAQKLTGSEAVERGLTICEKCHTELIDALRSGE